MALTPYSLLIGCLILGGLVSVPVVFATQGTRRKVVAAASALGGALAIFGALMALGAFECWYYANCG